jgi:molybdopterin synthase catalytic subunit
MITTQITDSPISAKDIGQAMKNVAAGATVFFSGDVRDNDGDREVKSLTYEIHPSAPQVIEELARKVAAKHDILAMAVAHRYGEIAIGESAFVAVVTAKHRAPAFAACQEIVDVVKEELPIWKHQVFADGTSEWVNSA